MSKPYKVPIANRISRRLLRPVFRGLFHILSKVKINGIEHVPKQGPYIIAINHISLFEPPFIIAFWPVCPEAAGAVEIWEKPGQNILARLFGGIQVHRGQYDRQLIDSMLNVLRSGYPLLIAPEGGRTHNVAMRQAHVGIAFLAEKTGVPVVPVGIEGTSDDFFTRAIHLKRPKLTLHIGPQITLPHVEGKGDARRLNFQANADLVMMHIAALLPSEYHGFYAKSHDIVSTSGDGK
jgi:1-acyl-sn-glycerol-3-phosphate acyltransferase